MTGTVDYRGDGTGGEPTAEASDRTLWQRTAVAEAVEDEGERFLDLAGFADGRLDPDERDRVAERLARDPDAAADVAAAGALGGTAEPIPEHLIARACALVSEPGQERGRVIPFTRVRLSPPTLPGVARWASLAAALVLASWLGFDLGSATSAAFAPVAQSAEDSLLRDLLEPSAGFVRDLTEGVRT